MTWAVVDASVVIKWVYSEELSQQAVAVRKKYQFVAPGLIVAEWSNILWKKVRRGEFTREEALIAAAALHRAGLELVPSAELALGALRLSLQLDHPAYDCFYLELSRLRDIPMVTADDRLARKLVAATDLPFPPVVALSRIS
ncbi:type II toxin-antitoxin system VapC family toxin [Aquibium oceanicum]|uniref:PIN domain-containing protein n=1 Tax=Aquibium oceanicum TaxID=1670800 RepID=A0A1L3SLD0_9HYPH|nr:type II toxin-antitoxin system VapC family toxin [Aquibium oceanicum]APH70171.1 hypothetical protein BSQ44_01315 [Aquibium oceanicum]